MSVTPEEMYEDQISPDELYDGVFDTDPTRDIGYAERTEEEWRRIAEDEASELTDTLVALTTGSSGGGRTPVPFPPEDQEKYVEDCARGFRLMGLEPGMMLNLAADWPHSSAWAVREGFRSMGGDTVNRSYEDFESFEDYREFTGFFDEVTSLLGIPGVVEDVGRTVSRDLGEDLESIFPDLKTAVLVGDKIMEEDRQDAREDWGADRALEYWATTETGMMAAGDREDGDLIPLVDRFYFEIIPEGTDEIRGLQEIEEMTRGEILVTDPYRQSVDITRWLPGDEVMVKPESPVNRINIQGRSTASRSLLVGGSVLKESVLESAVEKTGGEGPEFGVRKTSPGNSERYGTAGHGEDAELLEFYLPHEIDMDRFLENLRDSIPEFRDAEEKTIDAIYFRDLDEFDTGWKDQKLIDDTR